MDVPEKRTPSRAGLSPRGRGKFFVTPTIVREDYGLTMTGLTVVLMTSLSTAARPSISLI